MTPQIYSKIVQCEAKLQLHIFCSLLEKLPDTRLASAKKRSLLTVNEHFEREYNAVAGALRVDSLLDYFYCKDLDWI